MALLEMPPIITAALPLPMGVPPPLDPIPLPTPDPDVHPGARRVRRYRAQPSRLQYPLVPRPVCSVPLPSPQPRIQFVFLIRLSADVPRVDLSVPPPVVPPSEPGRPTPEAVTEGVTDPTPRPITDPKSDTDIPAPVTPLATATITWWYPLLVEWDERWVTTPTLTLTNQTEDRESQDKHLTHPPHPSDSQPTHQSAESGSDCDDAPNLTTAPRQEVSPALGWFGSRARRWCDLGRTTVRHYIAQHWRVLMEREAGMGRWQEYTGLPTLPPTLRIHQHRRWIKGQRANPLPPNPTPHQVRFQQTYHSAHIRYVGYQPIPCCQVIETEDVSIRQLDSGFRPLPAGRKRLRRAMVQATTGASGTTPPWAKKSRGKHGRYLAQATPAPPTEHTENPDPDTLSVSGTVPHGHHHRHHPLSVVHGHLYHHHRLE